jgi:hypothetical protein
MFFNSRVSKTVSRLRDDHTLLLPFVRGLSQLERPVQWARLGGPQALPVSTLLLLLLLTSGEERPHLWAAPPGLCLSPFVHVAQFVFLSSPPPLFVVGWVLNYKF